LCNFINEIKDEKNKLLLINVLLMASFLLGCQTPYHIVGQDQIANSPCITADSGVNIRIKNNGKIAFTKVVLKDTKSGLEFPGLKPGQVSCYKNRSSLWSNPSLDIQMSKQDGYIQTLMLLATDHVGESQIRHGYITIVITITKVHGKLNVKYDLIREPLP